MSARLRIGVRFAWCILLWASYAGVLPSVAVAERACVPPAIDVSRSLVVTDGALDKSKFSFENTINAILTSLQIPPTAENRENFLRSLLTSFNDDDMVNPVSGLRVKVDLGLHPVPKTPS